jgi:hypothetical protein
MTKYILFSTLVGFWGTTLLIPSFVQGFATVRPNQRLTSRPWGLLSTTDGSATTTTPTLPTTPNDDYNKEQSSSMTEPSSAVRAPLNYIGPYPSLALTFPDLATANQKQKNATGISLDFILDTAANTNTLNAEVAQQLGLSVVGAALPGIGSAGALAGGETFLLGDAQLQGLPAEEEKFTFMTGLTASALPIASPAAAGLLSLSFMQCFTGGVDFLWGGASGGESQLPPSITFHADAPTEQVLQGRTRVELQRIPVTELLSVIVKINGVDMPALLDTGSPVTVMNAQAAKLAGVESAPDPAANKNNPFAALQSKFQQAQAASRGEILTIFGAGGNRVNLCKSTGKEVDVSMDGSNGEKVQFGSGSVYVGDLPGLAALNGIGVESPPAVVLGMDVLRRRPSMLLRATENEAWF